MSKETLFSTGNLRSCWGSPGGLWFGQPLYASVEVGSFECAIGDGRGYFMSVWTQVPEDSSRDPYEPLFCQIGSLGFLRRLY